MDYPEADRFMEAAINDALAALPKATSADKIADWLWANRWPSFPDGIKNYGVQRFLRSAFCEWAGRQAHYYSALSHPDAPYDDDRPF